MGKLLKFYPDPAAVLEGGALQQVKNGAIM